MSLQNISSSDEGGVHLPSNQPVLSRKVQYEISLITGVDLRHFSTAAQLKFLSGLRYDGHGQ